MDTEAPNRRAEIVREALALLDESGFDAVTLRAVAGRLGRSLSS